MEPEDRPLWKRIRWRWVVLALVVIFVLIPLLMLFWAWRIFGGIERVDVSPVLSSGNGTNYLIVGSDSREGSDEEAPGQRSDTMMILHFGDDGTKIMSVPRDLWVVNAATGEEGKINGAYNPDAGGGPTSLIETISDNLDIPIDRYMEVDFVSFAGLVDSVGGVTIDFPHPATDANSGLNVTESGPVQLDGEQALAYVRSRYYTEHIDGQLVEDGSGDLGRVQRQQRFLTAVFSELGNTRNPLTLMRSFESVAEGLRIDDKMSMWDALRLGWRLRGANPEPIELPTDNAGFTSTSALVLADGADSVLNQFR